MTSSTFPPSASFVASPRSSPVESVDRSCVKAATSGQGSARCASTVLAQTSAIVLAGLMADRGRYAVESAGSSRWDPETSAEVAQAARVREFREQYHLLDDADFAFAFRSAEEALLAGGRGLADAWTKARSEQTEELMPLAASTVEAGSSRDRPAPALRLPAPPVPVRKGGTLSQQAFSADSVNRRVEALAKVFEDAGFHRPSVGNLSDAILAEWKLQLIYLARDAHWLPPTLAEPAFATPGKNAPPAATPATSKFALGKSIQGKQVARVLRDGTLLCQAFQEGSCKSKGGTCKLGQHRCGHVTKKERVCGAPNHGAVACRNTPKA